MGKVQRIWCRQQVWRATLHTVAYGQDRGKRYVKGVTSMRVDSNGARFAIPIRLMCTNGADPSFTHSESCGRIRRTTVKDLHATVGRHLEGTARLWAKNDLGWLARIVVVPAPERTACGGV